MQITLHSSPLRCTFTPGDLHTCKRMSPEAQAQPFRKRLWAKVEHVRSARKRARGCERARRVSLQVTSVETAKMMLTLITRPREPSRLLLRRAGAARTHTRVAASVAATACATQTGVRLRAHAHRFAHARARAHVRAQAHSHRTCTHGYVADALAYVPREIVRSRDKQRMKWLRRTTLTNDANAQ
eukprot:4665752-Pleurochrysis_carterae.AAC.1